MPSSRRAGFVSIVGSKAQYPRFISWVFWINRMLLILSKAALISRNDRRSLTRSTGGKTLSYVALPE